MKIAVGSDMNTHLCQAVVSELKKMGHELRLFGALLKEPAPWSAVAVEVGQAVASGEYEQGILFCWTGTGISMAANKVRGIRCALCQDAETARGARLWNDANILAMSLRAVSEEIAKEMLLAWFETGPSEDPEDLACISYLNEVEKEL